MALATRLADYPLAKEFAYSAQARSRTCGSTIDVGLDLGSDGRICALGMQVSACAVGQSSAAILADSAIGRLPEEIETSAKAIERWLSEPVMTGAALPDWPQLAALEGVHEHKGRHGALLLAWNGVTQALSTGQTLR